MLAVPSRQRSSSRFLARVLPGAKPAAFPGFIEPALATLGSKVPGGPGYAHEVKLDGYRVQAHLQDGRVTLYTRSGLDWTKRFPRISADIGRLPAGKLVIDGEVVSADAEGRPNFGALQNDLKQRRFDRMVYYVFDLLHLDSFDTRAFEVTSRAPRGSFAGVCGARRHRMESQNRSRDPADAYAPCALNVAAPQADQEARYDVGRAAL
jgi:ATP-dependent DNA ligase